MKDFIPTVTISLQEYANLKAGDIRKDMKQIKSILQKIYEFQTRVGGASDFYNLQREAREIMDKNIWEELK